MYAVDRASVIKSRQKRLFSRFTDRCAGRTVFYREQDRHVKLDNMHDNETNEDNL